MLFTLTSGFPVTTRSTNAIVSGEVDQLVPVQVGLSQNPRHLGNFDSARALPGAKGMHGGTEPSLADKLRHVCDKGDLTARKAGDGTVLLGAYT